ncbi:MAG: CHASE2 domain-containing protein [Microcoleus sp. SIO2G3]|nr:CHASE2 domain-containing protein [Microcoleus sp. SIO2G3]
MVFQLAHNLRSRLFGRSPLGKATKAFAGTVLLTSLVLTGGIIALRQFGALEEMELGGYDRLVRSRPDEGLDERLLVVGVTEEDIQRRKEFPLHDGTLAEVLEKLLRYEPSAVGIDIGRDVPQGPAAGRARLIKVLKESDHLFAVCVLSSATEPGVPAAPGVPPERIGFAEFPQDPDRTIRRTALVSTPTPPPQVIGTPHLCNYANPDNQLLSLSFQLASTYLEPKDIVPEQTESGEIQLGSVVFPRLTENAGGYTKADAPDYQLMLNYRSPSSAVRQVSITQVLQGQVDPAWVKDRIILIGYTSQVAKDTFATPYVSTEESTRNMPGVVIHAQATSQILSAVLDGRPLVWFWPEVVEILWIWGWSLVGGIIAFYLRRTWQFLLVGGVALITCSCLPYLLFLQGGWVPMVPSAIALLITAAGVSFVDRATKAGYTQAVYEQLREQLVLGGKLGAEQGQKARQADYLEDLVRRARSIRQQSNPTEELDSHPLEDAPQPQAISTSNSGMKDVDTLYQQIKDQVESDLEREGKEHETTKAQRLAQAKEKRLQNLLARSRSTRTHQDGNLKEQGVSVTPQDSTNAQSDSEVET